MNELLKSIEPMPRTIFTPFMVWVSMIEPSYELSEPPYEERSGQEQDEESD